MESGPFEISLSVACGWKPNPEDSHATLREETIAFQLATVLSALSLNLTEPGQREHGGEDAHLFCTHCFTGTLAYWTAGKTRNTSVPKGCEALFASRRLKVGSQFPAAAPSHSVEAKSGSRGDSQSSRSRQRTLHKHSFSLWTSQLAHLGTRLLFQTHAGRTRQEAVGAAHMLTRQELAALPILSEQQDQ